MEFTKEQLIEQASYNLRLMKSLSAEQQCSPSFKADFRLMEIVLASLEAEPVYFVEIEDGQDINAGRIEGKNRPDLSLLPDGINQLYTAPPAPVFVPEEVLAGLEHEANHVTAWHHIDEHSCKVYRRDLLTLVDACRAAMLQGADGNSPVVPEGWVMVPVEPTEDMIINGFESEPDESFSDEKEWEAYEAMSGCQQAAHRAKLCWSAMLSVAPKPEA